MSAMILPHTSLDWDQILKKNFERLFKAKETKHTVIFQARHNPWLGEFETNKNQPVDPIYPRQS